MDTEKENDGKVRYGITPLGPIFLSFFIIVVVGLGATGLFRWLMKLFD